MVWLPIQFQDRAFFEAWFLKTKYPVSDYNFTHLNIWKNAFQYQYAIIHDFLVISGVDPLTQESYTLMPIGDGNLSPVIETLWVYFQKSHKPMIIKAVTPDMKSALSVVFNRDMDFELERNNYEYIYETNKIANYTSKKLKRKREQCHSFEMHYEYTVKSYVKEDYDGVMALLKGWYEDYGDYSDPIINGEREGVQYIIDHYDNFSCTGFVFKVKGKVIGFSLAEQLTGEILLIHFEKGDRNYKGIYDVMKRDLSKQFDMVKYLSLEEDMGIRGLRTAKKMYEPTYLIEKGSLHFKESISFKESQRRGQDG